MNIFILLLNLYFSTNLYAQEVASDHKIIFESHQLDHVNEGCPTNSHCPEKIGKIRKIWIKLLESKPTQKKMNSFFKKYGTLFGAFLLKAEDSKDFILLDSRCPNHNLPKQKITLAQRFIKHTNEFKKFNGVVLNEVYVLNKTNKVNTIPAPQGSFPVQINGKSLYFSMDLDGNYYGLETNSTGKVSITKAKIIKHFPTKVNCPKQLIEHAKSLKTPANLYSQFYCRNIWDIQSKSYKTAMLGWICL